MNTDMTIASWSGGKDSCLACYKALQQGYNIRYLLNFISKEYKRCCFHGIEARLLQLQAECIGIPLVQKEVSQDMKLYEEEFKNAVSGLMDLGARQIVFGDIYLLDHASWVERVCKDLGISAIEPLWNQSASQLMREFIELGFKAIVVSCQADKFTSDFVGRIIDEKLVLELESRSICPCGENGEFHTLVIDGPFFKQKIEITKSQAVLKKGFWEYWFLDIKEYEVQSKAEVAAQL